MRVFECQSLVEQASESGTYGSLNFQFGSVSDGGSDTIETDLEL